LKIDRSFVMSMDRDEDNAAIVRATVELAHNLGLRVVAQGVETADSWERLRALGCDEIQGFLRGRPVSPEDIDARLLTGPLARSSDAPAGRTIPLVTR
jgi:diguanylate cyclase